MKRLGTAAAVLAAAVGICAQTADLDSVLCRLQAEHDIAGMSVTVVKEGEIVFSQSRGLRDIARNLPVTARTKYRIASISKLFTAIALMQLQEQEKAYLDDDVGPVLGFGLRNPVFPGQPITYRQLLSHTSSLRDGEAYNRFLTACYSEHPPGHIREFLENGGAYYHSSLYDSLRGPAQGWFQYGNVNFGVLASLIELHSGKSFDVYCRDHIFKPLGISCSFNVRHLPDIDDLAVLYRKPDSLWVPQKDNYRGAVPPPVQLPGYEPGSNGYIHAPQGGLRASAEDLARVMIMLMNGGTVEGVRILGPESVEEILTSVWTDRGNNGDTIGGVFEAYGLACHWTERLVPGLRLAGHSGLAYGLVSDMYFSPENTTGVVFICSGGRYRKGSTGWYTLEEQVLQAVFRWAENI